jgi:hypothetical protein
MLLEGIRLTGPPNGSPLYLCNVHIVIVGLRCQHDVLGTVFCPH